MQTTIKEQAQELIRVNLNQFLKVSFSLPGDGILEKHKLDYLTVLAKTTSLYNINFILDNIQMDPEQSIFLKELKIEILK
jgi:hypothetical protein